jgi:hypothetical protein
MGRLRERFGNDLVDKALGSSGSSPEEWLTSYRAGREAVVRRIACTKLNVSLDTLKKLVPEKS